MKRSHPLNNYDRYFNFIFNNIIERNGENFFIKEPAEILESFKKAMSLEVGNSRKKLESILEKIISFSPNVWSPDYANYLYSYPDPIGLIGDLLFSFLNTNVHTYEASPALAVIESELIKTMNEILGYGDQGGGVFCPGGSYSNMYAMYLAKRRFLANVTKTSFEKNYNPVIFTSEMSHYSIEKGALFLGIDQDSIIKIKCDKKGRMIPENLLHQISTLQFPDIPFFVNATAGTTVLGAFDPIETIWEILKNTKIWLHVDAAWGGAVLFSAKFKNLAKGIEKADSVTWDLHKAMRAPLLCSALLVKEYSCLREAFFINENYLFHDSSTYDKYSLGKITLQCGRRGDALKFWLMWNMRGAKYFSEQIDNGFSRVLEVIKNIKKSDCFWLYDEKLDFWNVCFWYIPEKYRKFSSISNCTIPAKTEIDHLTKRLYQCMKRDGQVMINFSNVYRGPSFLRLIINVDLNTLYIEKILDIVKSLGLIISANLSELLVFGGDDRQALYGTGKNYILIAPEPEAGDIIYRSSCSGSQVSADNFHALLMLHQKLKTAQMSFPDSMREVHNRIRNILHIDDHTTLITIPSGTEAEYVPLLFAKAYAGDDCTLVNILTGAGEIGSQSAIAASGVYFTGRTPSGALVSSGDKVSGISKNVKVITIPFESNISGKNKISWLQEVKANVKLHNTIVLLHIVDSSKLGRRMDVIFEVDKLCKTYAEKLLVVIDSCQSRTDAELTKTYLKLGFMVMITGSKFEQGPPFSGCVIIPTTITNTLGEQSFNNLLSGLKDFITKYDISGDASIIKNYLPCWMNVGLMMRWYCALDNWEKYRSINENVRNGLIQGWVDSLIALIHGYTEFSLLYGGELQKGAVGERNTIISFKLIKNGRAMTSNELKKIYIWLNESVYSKHRKRLEKYLHQSERETLDKKFLVGQPVEMGNYAVIRIAIGARLVCDIAERGIEEVLSEDKKLLNKTALLVKHFESIDK